MMRMMDSYTHPHPSLYDGVVRFFYYYKPFKIIKKNKREQVPYNPEGCGLRVAGCFKKGCRKMEKKISSTPATNYFLSI